MEALLDEDSSNPVVNFPRFPAIDNETSPMFSARQSGQRQFQASCEVARLHVLGVAAEVGTHILSLGGGPFVGRRGAALGE